MNKNEVAQAAWKGIIWRFLERCSSQIVSLVVSIILARLLLPEQYGIVAMTMIFVAISEVFITSGFGSALIQQAEYDERAFSTMFWVSIAFSLLIYTILFSIAPYISLLMHTPDLTIVLRVLGLRLPISAVNSIQQAYVSQQMIFRKFFFSTLSGTISSGIIGLAMAYTGFGVWALVGQNMTMTIVNTAALHLIIPWRPTLYFNKKVFYRLYGYSWRSTITNLIGTTFNYLGDFFIGRYYTSADLAFANRGNQFPSVIAGNVSATIQTVLFPAFSHLKEDRVLVREAVRKALMLGSFLVVGLMAVLAGMADTVITVILTDKWANSIPYLQWACLGQCFSILGMINLQTINALGRADIALKLEFIKKPFWFLALVVGVFISPLAIVAGVAIYGVIAYIINSYPNEKLLGYGTWQQIKDIIAPFFPAGIVFVILQLVQDILPHNFMVLFIEGGLSLIIYFILARLLHLPGAESFFHLLSGRLRW